MLTKVEIIENSLRCFRLGLLGLMPVIGLPMAVQAIVCYRRVLKDRSGLWNPAHHYWRWGGVCARLGVVLFLVSLWVVQNVVSH